ncbi:MULTISPECIES: hypothetical protein [unclassified Bradyrhizobium]|uniref:hypothetical protein n=1 Tax=unclassified Bradyrhizobium TaxID=2631580 RepID=UPI001BAD3B4C|nr:MULTISPECIES: hypothetical protein [unclassified Bradyrhizobium]MBR1208762.1 hypothetical protein [Bradyrhizobium sp. AUGA SZCCT0124]MBR1316955.1 hypothetical protein [Bradyrhizobium sp. AUGA SZCCT0051]MBR1345249.1 hypothetical protein [Bradyrhizobium sp. AUGA SZCCT0105]MBR1360049.1 hypothetical protein [Bradyrhizobium sp. AUGA SZCCT0045]
MIHRITTSDGLTPGPSFQVARPDAIRDKPGRAETWGELSAKLAIAFKDQDRGRAGQDRSLFVWQ